MKTKNHCALILVLVIVLMTVAMVLGYLTMLNTISDQKRENDFLADKLQEAYSVSGDEVKLKYKNEVLNAKLDLMKEVVQQYKLVVGVYENHLICSLKGKPNAD